MLGLLIGLAFSALAGYIAATLMSLKGPWYLYVLLGVAGGFVGTFLFGLIGFGSNSVLSDAIVSVLGSCVVIFIYRMLKK